MGTGLRHTDVNWVVWMKMPVEAGDGWSLVADNLTQEDAERFAASMTFPARAMPKEAPFVER